MKPYHHLDVTFTSSAGCCPLSVLQLLWLYTRSTRMNWLDSVSSVPPLSSRTARQASWNSSSFHLPSASPSGSASSRPGSEQCTASVELYVVTAAASSVWNAWWWRWPSSALSTSSRSSAFLAAFSTRNAEHPAGISALAPPPAAIQMNSTAARWTSPSPPWRCTSSRSSCRWCRAWRPGCGSGRRRRSSRGDFTRSAAARRRRQIVEVALLNVTIVLTAAPQLRLAADWFAGQQASRTHRPQPNPPLSSTTRLILSRSADLVVSCCTMRFEILSVLALSVDSGVQRSRVFSLHESCITNANIQREFKYRGMEAAYATARDQD